MLVGELLAFDEPVVVALNMVDIAQRRGLTLDAATLSAALGCPVVPIVARRGREPRCACRRRPSAHARARRVRTRRTAAPQRASRSVGRSRRRSAACTRRGRGDRHAHRAARQDVHASGARRARVRCGDGRAVLDALRAGDHPDGPHRGDVRAPGRARGARRCRPGSSATWCRTGIIGGIAGTVVFLPQICLLFFLISLLEDTGYLARAAFVMDRLLCRFGLPGHAFVPLLTSHACALPGIMSTRLIPDRRDRLATILVAPFMSCSARLPVYVLLTSLLFVGPAAPGRARVRWLLSARRGGGAPERAASPPHARQGHGAADGAGAAVVQGAVAPQRAAHGAGIRGWRSSRRPAPSSWRSAS